jgi:hypothetical protein
MKLLYRTRDYTFIISAWGNKLPALRDKLLQFLHATPDDDAHVRTFSVTILS